MLHDKAGHAWVTFAKPLATDGSDADYGDEYWLLRAVEQGIAGSAGDGAKVVCTSAGRTTRLVFGLVESREGIDLREGIDMQEGVDSRESMESQEGVDSRESMDSREDIDPPRANYDSSDAQSFVPSSDNVRFVSLQDGSIISATHNSVHLRVTLGEQLRQRYRHEFEVSDAHLADENACGSTLCVKITTNGIETLTTSLEKMTIQGTLQPLY
ncbi:unnamed protein product, partial [Laminaria digitata]